MSAAIPAAPLFDRVPEHGGAVVVRGDAGIGKSALLLEASRLAAARGMRTLTIADVASEAQLAFAGLVALNQTISGR